MSRGARDMLRFGDLRLELDRDSTTSRILLGDVDISRCVKAVTVRCVVGDVTTATLETYVGSLRVNDAGLLVEGPPPPAWWVRAWAALGRTWQACKP